MPLLPPVTMACVGDTADTPSASKCLALLEAAGSLALAMAAAAGCVCGLGRGGGGGKGAGEGLGKGPGLKGGAEA